MIDDQFASGGVEGFEIGIGGVERGGGFIFGGLHAGLDGESFVVPIGFFVNHVGVEIDSEVSHQAAGGSGAGDPQSPAAGAFFCAGQESGENGNALRITQAVVKLFSVPSLAER